MGYATIAVHGGIQDESKKAINPPVYLSSTFIQPDSETEGEYCYSRGNNPTRASVEDLAARLENAEFALATSSGMAATSLVFELLKEGERILINNNVYGGTWRFVSNLFENRGLEYEIVDDFNTYDFEDAKENAKLNKLNNCEFIAGDVLVKLDEIEEKPDFIILDPPREGCTPKALNKIISYGVPYMVYISCKPTSLAEDLVNLQHNGYKVIRACAVDEFPNTQHVETVCLLTHT